VIDEALGFLRCPQCAEGGVLGRSGGVLGRSGGVLGRSGGVLRCAAGHSFDLAQAGYVSLLPPGRAKNAGDTAAMVRARQAFLAEGHYSGLAAGIGEAAVSSVPPVASSPGPGCVVEVGAGTGYYLAEVLDRVPSRTGLALDVSKPALRLAARAHPRAAAVGADAWRPLPVLDSAADLVLNVFAPREGAELRRILRPEGRLLVVTPAADHLNELIGPLGLLGVDDRKEQRLTGKLRPYFELAAASEYRATLALGRAAVGLLTAMGPSSWHTEPEELAARISELGDPVEVTVAARIATYRPV
jgi:23S rRNA (guanine745-N1)-methyltransferase